MDLIRELAEAAVQKWGALEPSEQREVVQELIPDIEQVSIATSCGLVLICLSAT